MSPEHHVSLPYPRDPDAAVAAIVDSIASPIDLLSMTVIELPDADRYSTLCFRSSGGLLMEFTPTSSPEFKSSCSMNDFIKEFKAFFQQVDSNVSQDFYLDNISIVPKMVSEEKPQPSGETFNHRKHTRVGEFAIRARVSEVAIGIVRLSNVDVNHTHPSGQVDHCNFYSCEIELIGDGRSGEKIQLFDFAQKVIEVDILKVLSEK